MNLEIVIPAIVAFFAVANLIIALYSIRMYRKYLFLIEINSDQNDALEKKLTLQTLLLEETQNLVAEQTRRIAQLESKNSSTQRTPEIVAEKTSDSEAAKPNIIERRHQVMTLAKRGQDVETIASTLGMLSGEVELIVNLNNGAAHSASA